MSDFLTNLVTRSFSQTASLKPMMASAFATPAANTGELVEEFSEPGIQEREAPQLRRSPASRPPIESAPISTSIVDETIGAVRSVQREVSQTPERPSLNQHTPEVVESPELKPVSSFAASPGAFAPLRETVFPTAAELTPAKTLTPETPAPPAVQKESPSIERPEPIRSAPSKAAAPVDRSAPTIGILQRRVVSKANNADTTHHAPKVAEPSARRIDKRVEQQISDSKPGVSPTSETNEPRIVEQIVERTTAPLEQIVERTTAPLEQIVERTTAPLEQIVERTAASLEQIVERTTAPLEQIVERTAAPLEQRPPQTSTAFTTLVPKPPTPPPFPVKVKLRPNPPTNVAHDETGTDLPTPETVINVAIGRIEVRAISQPSPRRERRPAGPKMMSLDDYVQQRSRGAQ